MVCVNSLRRVCRGVGCWAPPGISTSSWYLWLLGQGCSLKTMLWGSECRTKVGRDRGSGQGRAEGLVSLQCKYSFESCLDPEGTNLGNKWLYLWVHRDGFGRRGFIIDLLWGGLEGYGSMTECYSLCASCAPYQCHKKTKKPHMCSLYPSPPVPLPFWI